MRCIFCKVDSSNSKSVEHIIPESLGNIEHILPPGLVCDKCNNYFAREIERPLLESQYFLHARFENLIPSKKNRIPIVKGIILPLRNPVQVTFENEGLICGVKSEDFSWLLENKKSKGGTLCIPHFSKPEGIDHVLSRFLGKVAIEALAHLALSNNETLESILVNPEELNPLISYVRRGERKIWSFHQREIYPADAMFNSEVEDEYYDVLHEFTFLYTDKHDLFFILAVFGIEYTINMGGDEIDGYLEWLSQNDYRSPLYKDGVNYSYTRDTLGGMRKGSTATLYSMPK